MTSHMKFDCFVLCRTSKHESYNFTQNHEKHKMTSQMKFDPFCSMQNIKNMKSYDTKPCKAQNDKPHEVWCFLFYVLNIKNIKSCDSTQNHAKHKMTSHTKFDLFVLHRTSKTWNLMILHKTMQSTKWQAPWSLMFFVLRIEHQKHEILWFYPKSCKAQNDKHHEVWCFLFYV